MNIENPTTGNTGEKHKPKSIKGSDFAGLKKLLEKEDIKLSENDEKKKINGHKKPEKQQVENFSEKQNYKMLVEFHEIRKKIRPYTLEKKKISKKDLDKYRDLGKELDRRGILPKNIISFDIKDKNFNVEEARKRDKKLGEMTERLSDAVLGYGKINVKEKTIYDGNKSERGVIYDGNYPGGVAPNPEVGYDPRPKKQGEKLPADNEDFRKLVEIQNKARKNEYELRGEKGSDAYVAAYEELQKAEQAVKDYKNNNLQEIEHREGSENQDEKAFLEELSKLKALGEKLGIDLGWEKEN